MHGWGGRGTQLHGFVEPLVARGYQVVALDGPAHGNTAGRRTTLFEFVSALGAVNERFGPFAAVIAHSFGNPAVMLAIQGGVLQTQRVVAISPPRTFAGMLDKFSRMLRLPEGVKQRVRRRIERRFGRDIWERLSVDQVAPTLTQPALILHDTTDAEVPVEEGIATARQWPGAHFSATHRWGHRRILRAPEVIAAAVKFIAEGEVPGVSLGGEQDNPVMGQPAPEAFLEPTTKVVVAGNPLGGLG
jgi:pimeloyl-ACP methyl ester carboxylesterase